MLNTESLQRMPRATPDYRTWTTDHLSREEQTRKYVIEFMPEISRLTQAKELNEMLQNYDWLVKLIGTIFQPALEAYARDPNAMTNLMREFVNTMYGTTVAVEWQKQVRAMIAAREGPFEYVNDPPILPGQERLILIARDGSDSNRDLNEEEIDHMYSIFQSAVRVTNENDVWNLMCNSIARFTLEAGCPNSVTDPLENIAFLRSRLHAHGAQSREYALQGEIDRLRSLCQSQGRIITNLAFRHLLEALPGPRPTNHRGEQVGSSQHWKNFWNNAWSAAERQDAGRTITDPPHPLLPLLQNFDRSVHAQVKNNGAYLYGTLSSNIHLFQGEFNVEADQWDILPAAILKALTPQTERKDDGSVDWEKERVRYR